VEFFIFYQIRKMGMLILRKSLFILFLVVLLFTLSCGGGGGSSSDSGSGTNSTPSISNLSISPNSATLNQGGGAITVTITLNFIDNGGDLSTATFFDYFNNGKNGVGTPTPIPGVNGQTSGIFRTIVILPTTQIGTHTGGVYVTDSGGRESNWLKGTFTVS
jgi:hypothetical protein